MGTPPRTFISLLLVGACADPGADSAQPAPPYEGVVAALQDDSSLGFLDLDGALIDTLDLHTELEGAPVDWMVHNVQIAPDARTAVATAMPPMDSSLRDQLLVVDLPTRSLLRRCDLDYGLAVAHVVTDGSTAWISAFDQDRIIAVDLSSCEILERYPLPAGTSPHGVRRSVDGASLYVAGMGDGSLHRVSLGDGALSSWELPGLAVQVAVIPDGSAVLVTLFDTRQIARLDLGSEEITVVDMPAGATGPAQIYPTPDSTGAWVADQGVLDGVAGRELFRVDAATAEATDRVIVDLGPHGVVVAPDGATAWATCLGTQTVVRVDTATGEWTGSTPVGAGPNGISLAAGGAAMP